MCISAHPNFFHWSTLDIQTTTVSWVSCFCSDNQQSSRYSMHVSGLNLENILILYSQLYVVCSKVGAPKTLYIYTLNKKTKKSTKVTLNVTINLKLVKLNSE